jgi:hypothetical protein
MQNNRGILGLALGGVLLLGTIGSTLAAPAVATSNVNVRSGPGTGYEAVDVLRRGERVDVEGCRGGWCFIDKRGPGGWVSWRYLGEVNRPSQPDVTFQFNFGNPPQYDRPWHHGRPGNGGWHGNGNNNNDGNGLGHHNGPGGGNGGNNSGGGNGGNASGPCLLGPPGSTFCRVEREGF